MDKHKLLLNCRLFRAVGGYANVAHLLSIAFTIKVNTIGSASEFAK